AQRAELREIEMHFGGRFGAGCHLEFDLDAVDGVRFTGALDVDGRDDQRYLALRGTLAQTTTDVSLRTSLQQAAVHVGGAACHGGPGVDVLLHGVFSEPLGCQHGHLARVHLGLASHAQHAAEMVDVAVRVDDSDTPPLTPLAAIELQRCGSGLGRHQRIDHDEASVALDEADVRNVQSAYLIDARHDFVQALFGGQLALPPQTGIHRWRCVTGEEGIPVVVPHYSPGGGVDG